jgi:hypothetical protein
MIVAPVKFATLVPIGNLTPMKQIKRFHWAGGVKLMIDVGHYGAVYDFMRFLSFRPIGTQAITFLSRTSRKKNGQL